jgi:hypothetical protein
MSAACDFQSIQTLLDFEPCDFQHVRCHRSKCSVDLSKNFNHITTGKERNSVGLRLGNDGAKGLVRPAQTVWKCSLIESVTESRLWKGIYLKITFCWTYGICGTCIIDFIILPQLKHRLLLVIKLPFCVPQLCTSQQRHCRPDNESKYIPVTGRGDL